MEVSELLSSSQKTDSEEENPREEEVETKSPQNTTPSSLECLITTQSSTSNCIPKKPKFSDNSLWQWKKYYATGTIPTGRSGHTSTLMPDDDVILTAGGCSNNKDLPDMFLLDISQLNWQKLPMQTSQPLVGHSCTQVPRGLRDVKGLFVIFGGWNGLTYSNHSLLVDPPSYDNGTFNLKGNGGPKTTVGGSSGGISAMGTTGSLLGARANLPFARRDHQGVYVGGEVNKVFIFGGWNSFEWNNTDPFNEIWTLDSEWNWSPYEAHGIFPSARRGHSMNFYEKTKSLVIFGGVYGYSKILNDIHTLEIENNEWNEIQPRGQGPDGRAWHSSCNLDDSLIIFGGINQNNAPTNDLYILGLEEFSWSKVDIPGAVPTARYAHSAVISEDRMIIIGGMTHLDIGDETSDDDTFTFELGDEGNDDEINIGFNYDECKKNMSNIYILGLSPKAFDGLAKTSDKCPLSTQLRCRSSSGIIGEGSSKRRSTGSPPPIPHRLKRSQSIKEDRLNLKHWDPDKFLQINLPATSSGLRKVHSTIWG